MSPPKSGHGGSPVAGFTGLAGLENLQPAQAGGQVLEPPEVVEIRAQAKKREERALQLERRRIALELIVPSSGQRPKPIDLTPSESEEWAIGVRAHVVDRVEMALSYADELIKQTGGGI